MSSSIPFLRVTIDSVHMANANGELTQFKELHIMRVGKTWGWSAWRCCIKLVTFLKNILLPHRTLSKASDLVSQIAVSTSPCDSSMSSFREFVSFRIWVVPSLLLSHPQFLYPETLGFSCLGQMLSHPLDTGRVSPGSPQITVSPSLSYPHRCPRPLTGQGVRPGKIYESTNRLCDPHRHSGKTISLLYHFLLKLTIRRWLNNRKKNRCSVNTKAS